MRYGVTAQLETQNGEWSGSRQVPYFELPDAIDEDAAREMARRILDPLNVHGERLHICAVALPTMRRTVSQLRADAVTLANYCSDAAEERDWKENGQPADHVFVTARRILDSFHDPAPREQ